LLHPDRISDDHVELFETYLIGPGMGGDGVADKLFPVMLKTSFEQWRFETEAFRQS